MNKKEIQALRRPFVRELFRDNGLNLAMTMIASLFTAAGTLIISWLIKEIVDLISGVSAYTFGTLLAAAGVGAALLLLSGLLLFAVGLIHERNPQNTIRGLLDERHFIIRWLLIFSAVTAILVFGAYGPGYTAAEFAYVQF